MKQRIYLDSSPYGRGFNLRIIQLDASGQLKAEAGPAVFTSVEEGTVMGEPATRIDKDACQQLMDDLWNLGFRPERGEMSVGQMTAVNAHLQDMRAMAFYKLGVPKP